MDGELGRSIRRHLVAALGVAVLVIFGVGGWASTTKLAGAVMAAGQLVVDSNIKKVQHPTGGVVGELNVRDGAQVKAGDIVMRLDETQTRATYAILARGLDELNARRARLEAERDDKPEFSLPPELLDRRGDTDVARILSGERRLFELRRSARAGQKAQLREREAQLQQEVRGLTDQASAKKHEIELIRIELEAMLELRQKNLVPISRVTALERDATRIEGERGQLIAAIAQTRGKIAETTLQVIQVDQDLRSEVAKELSEIRAKTAELSERKVAAEDQLNRVNIRAPLDGKIHQLAVHTVGGVINPGEPIMLVVPDGDALMVEARVAPQDIDQVRYEQPVVLRFTAFNQRTTPEINGKVSRVSADLTQDQRTGLGYYTVRVMFNETQFATLGLGDLVPGMPVEAFIQTGERTALSYLVKPLQDQVARAFREK
ncbi:MAG: HlyD family type I secretion periplasmic adaptor subunit [Fimbriimonadaceae bacterium]|nr:HlyD family type I secretion periplasmic adaptor subunit [Fimbriimonadaceae bacterium]